MSYNEKIAVLEALGYRALGFGGNWSNGICVIHIDFIGDLVNILKV